MGLRGAHFDRSWKQLSEDAVDLRVCECCPTAAAVTTDGPIVAYRNRSADEVRDIYVSRFTGDAWTVPAPVHDDGWKIDGCPVNGPAISADRPATSRSPGSPRRRTTGTASSRSRGTPDATFSAPVQVDDAGSLGRVDVEQLADGSAVVGWIELAGKSATFKVRRVERGGQRSAAVVGHRSGRARNSGYPRLARRGQELVFAWTGSGRSLARRNRGRAAAVVAGTADETPRSHRSQSRYQRSRRLRGLPFVERFSSRRRGAAACRWPWR